jgi:hypothetical protein
VDSSLNIKDHFIYCNAIGRAYTVQVYTCVFILLIKCVKLYYMSCSGLDWSLGTREVFVCLSNLLAGELKNFTLSNVIF